MTPQELDDTAGRLEEIGLEEEKLRSKLLVQVGECGFTPPRGGEIEAPGGIALPVHR